MDEVEKMYENAGIKKDWTAIGFGDIEDCYPPFTAEKQLNIVKFLLNHSVYYDVDNKGNYWFHISDDCYTYYYNKFEVALANIINEMWQDLTEEERTQIKEILE